jgi:toxin CptA
MHGSTSLTKSVPPIAFDYRPSLRLIALLLVAAALAGVSLAISAIPPLAKAIIAVVAAGYFGISLRRFVLHTPARVVWQSSGRWSLVDRRHCERDADLIRAAVRGEWLLIELRSAHRTPAALVLAPDNSDAEIRRALRVRLSRNDDT